jgi:hypothetical protein
MDNILKAVLAILGLAGLITFMLPSGNPVKDQPSTVAVQGAAPPVAFTPPPAGPTPEPVAEAVETNGGAPGAVKNEIKTPTAEDYSYTSFGQPMINPQPSMQFGGNEGQANNTANQQAQSEQSGNYSEQGHPPEGR